LFLYINLQTFLDLKIGRNKNMFESNTISEIVKYLLSIEKGHAIVFTLDIRTSFPLFSILVCFCFFYKQN